MDGEARDLVKEGVVSEVFADRHSARVTFEDKDNLVSAELPVVTTFAFDNKSYAMPDVGEKVLCLFATNDGTSGEGWIIGSRYHEKSTPTVKDVNINRIDFKDGTFIEYNRKSHAMKIQCKGTLEITCEKDIIIKGQRIYLNE